MFFVSSVLVFLNPKSSPTFPPGLGTGHSRLAFLLSGSAKSSSVILLNRTTPSWISGSCDTCLRLRLLLPFSSCIISPSAYVIRGAGHGRTCGRVTTKKLAIMVVANKEDVIRERGWRCGGGIVSIGRERVML